MTVRLTSNRKASADPVWSGDWIPACAGMTFGLSYVRSTGVIRAQAGIQCPYLNGYA